jgi:hypothetical protein
VQEDQATPILQRLLAVTSDCRAAFIEASYAVSSPRIGALLVRRAEHQNRIAEYLTEHLASGRVPSAMPLHSTRGGATRALRAGGLPLERDPHVLLGACIRVLDTAILEFGRAYSPSMPLAQRISLERHHDQMRWSRDELVELQRTYKWQYLKPADPNGEAANDAEPVLQLEPGNGGTRWFGMANGGTTWASNSTEIIPSGATHFPDAELRKTS